MLLLVSNRVLKSLVATTSIKHGLAVDFRPLPPSSMLFPYTTLFRSPDYLRFDFPFERAVTDDEKRAIEDEVRGIVRDDRPLTDRKSTRLNSSHPSISYAVCCLKKKKAGF